MQRIHLSWTAIALQAAMAVAAAAPPVASPPRQEAPAPADGAPAGHWAGTIAPPGGEGAFSLLQVDRDEDGAWSASLTCLVIGAMNSPGRGLAVQGSSLSLDVSTMVGAVARLRCLVDESGRSMTGTMDVAQPGGEAGPSWSVDLRRRPRPAEMPGPLAFSGELQVRGMGGLDMTIVLSRMPDGSALGYVDVPAQMLSGFPLVDVTWEGDRVTARLPVMPPAIIEAEVQGQGQRLAGRFRQGPLDLDLQFTRDAGYVFGEPARPQHPRPPYPYADREVQVRHPAGHALAGTLTLPEVERFGEGPYAAVVLISGSGPQDRDETILGHKPFLVIADYLTRRGVAVMRYDDRGVGGSQVEDPSLVMEATSRDLATDTLAVVNHLRTIEEIDPRRIGLLGHSEGAIIAPMVGQMTDEIAFMVLMAAPGVPGRDLLPRQLALGIAATGGDTEMAERYAVEMAAAIDLLLEDGDPEALDAALRASAETRLLASGVEVSPDLVEQIAQAQRQFLAPPWMRFFLAYDPAPALAATRCPVLALNGTLDLQVWHLQNLDLVQQIMTSAERDITVRRYDGLNHLFQPATTGAGDEYARIETTIDEQVLDDITSWILSKTGG